MKRLHAQNPSTYTVKDLCGLFGVSKQAYYKHDPDVDLRRAAQEEFALQFIRSIRAKDPGIGGVKLWRMYCHEFGQSNRIGRDRFCEIFDRYGYKLRRRRHKPRTTDSSHSNHVYPNLVKNVIPLRIGEIIVGDITYIPLQSEGSEGDERAFCYVCMLMDSYSKFVLGYSVGETLEARYPMLALTQATAALEDRGVDLSQTIHHTDRGVQYTCSEYIMMLSHKRMDISMTESGNPKDNSEAERLNNTLKNELLKDIVFHDVEQVRDTLKSAVDFYNYERPHLSLENRTPYEASRCEGRFKREWISYRERAIDALYQKNQDDDVAV